MVREQATAFSGPTAHGEIGYAVHNLVGDRVDLDQRRAVVELPERDGPRFLWPERRRDEEGVLEGEVDHRQDPAVPAVHAAPAMAEEVVVREARVDVSVDDSRVLPVVVGVARDVVRCPAGAARVDEAVEATIVVAHVERDDLRGAQEIAGAEDAAG